MRGIYSIYVVNALYILFTRIPYLVFVFSLRDAERATNAFRRVYDKDHNEENSIGDKVSDDEYDADEHDDFPRARYPSI